VDDRNSQRLGHKFKLSLPRAIFRYCRRPGCGLASDRATFFGHRTPGGGRSGSRRCFHHETIDRIPPARSSTPKTPVPPAGVSFIANRDSGSIWQGCAFDTGRCRHMSRRNPQPVRILASRRARASRASASLLLEFRAGEPSFALGVP
jgi:hypothetical protein